MSNSRFSRPLARRGPLIDQPQECSPQLVLIPGRQGRTAIAREDRCRLIAELESRRGNRLVICYITSSRFGFADHSDDIVVRLYRHLESAKLKDRLKNGVDLLVHSDGGSDTMSWRIINLIREYTDDFAVLIPHHAFGAATAIALAADTIVMHKMARLSPLGPGVPGSPKSQASGELAPISVEEASAFSRFVKDDLGIEHEDRVIQALLAVTEKVPPPATFWGEHAQALDLAGKLLKKLVSAKHERDIDGFIEKLKSTARIHAIGRSEAREELKLNVQIPGAAVEEAMWKLYKCYQSELKLTENFDPFRELELQSAGRREQSLRQAVQASRSGHFNDPSRSTDPNRAKETGAPAGPRRLSEEELVKLACAMIPLVAGEQPIDKFKLEKLKSAYLESSDRTDIFLSDLTIERTRVKTPAGIHDSFRQEPTWQRWEIEP